MTPYSARSNAAKTSPVMSSRFFMTSMLGHTRREVVTACSTWRGGLHVDRAAAFSRHRHRLGPSSTPFNPRNPHAARLHAARGYPLQADSARAIQARLSLRPSARMAGARPAIPLSYRAGRWRGEWMVSWSGVRVSLSSASRSARRRAREVQPARGCAFRGWLLPARTTALIGPPRASAQPGVVASAKQR
jgi:hypothetical protein